MPDSIETILGLRLNTPSPLNMAWPDDAEFNWSRIAGLFDIPTAWHAPGCFLSGETTDAAWVQSSLAWQARMGRLVLLMGTLGVTSRIGGSGYVNMSIPYTAANVGQMYPKIELFQVSNFTPSIPNCGSLVFRPKPGTKKAHLISSNWATSADESVTNIGANFGFRFQGFYWTDDPLP